MRLAIASVLAALLVNPAPVQAIPAFAVIGGCRDFVGEDKARKELFGAGYCNGIITTLMNYGHQLPVDLRFCLPDDMTNGRAIKFLIEMADKKEPPLEMSFETFVITNMRIVWPCK